MCAARRLSEHDIDRIVEMRERGETYALIARAIDCSESIVSWHCLRLGVEPPTPGLPSEGIRGPLVVERKGFTVRRYTEADDVQLLALEAEGLSNSEIGRRMGRQPNSVLGRLYTLARRQARREALEGVA